MRVLSIIWTAMVGGALAYTALIYVLMSTGILELDVLDPTIMNFVGAAVIVYMAGGVFVRRMLVARIATDAGPEERLQRYTSATIVGLALAESGGLLVITMGLLAGARSWVLVGGLASVVLMYMARPSASDLGPSA